MNMLIIAGLMVIALLAIIGAVALTVSEEKTPAATQKTPAQTPPIATEQTAVVEPPVVAEPTAAPEESKKELIPMQSLPVVQDDARMAFVNGQFHELVTQLHALHQQSQEIERRLSMLSQAADAIKRSQAPSFSIEETEEYHLPEPVASAR